MHAAIEKGYKDVVEMLLDKGAQPNKEDDRGQFPLHWAVLKSQCFRKEMVQLLLERGADPHRADKWGKTPLQLASEMGYEEVAQKMIKQTTAKGEGERMQASLISKLCPIL